MKRLAVFCLALLGLCASLTAEPRYSPWTLTLAPTYGLPLTAGDFSPNELFASSLGGTLGLEYALQGPLSLRVRMAYASTGFLPSGSIVVSGSLGEASLLGGLGFGLPLGKALSLQAYLDGGLVYGSLSDGTTSWYGDLMLGGGLEFGLGHGFSTRLSLAYDYKVGLYSGFGAGLSLGLRLPAAVRQGPARLLDLKELKLGAVFPIFRSYYDQHSLGTIHIVNTSKETVQDVRVSFLIKQYMDAPKDCGRIASIAPGKSVDLPLYALFNDAILGVTEATKVNAVVTVTYGESGEQTTTATVLVYDRNALTWSDDRHAAAFVSNKDPWVQDLTGHILAATSAARNAELDKNLQTAIAIHQGLKTYGIGYMISTTRPFLQEVVNPEIVDTLKFPRQTLGFRAGDCADLSVLYASCFEAAGVETAFITVPGHILMAIDLGISRSEAASRGYRLADLIEQDGKLWLPIETTMRESGLLEVWSKGASQWRDASAKGQSAFYPIHEAWKTYAPVGLPADGSTVAAPPDAAISASFKAELAKAIDAELGSRIAALGPLPSKGADLAKALNSRGILYGKYGRLAEAEKDFQAAAKLGSGTALINLGNVAFLRNDAAAALGYFQQASKQNPDNPRILANLAKAAAALGKADLVAQTLDTMKKLDPQAAERYASLAAAATTAGTRAAQQESAGLEWF